MFGKVLSILCNTDAQITLVWEASHIGILGNERADVQTGRGTQRSKITMEIGLKLVDAYNQYIDKLWQAEWTNATTACLLPIN